MPENIQDQLKKILTLVKECPEHLQEKCFELLFNHMISSGKQQQGKDKETDDKDVSPPVLETETSEGEEIVQGDVHSKVRALVKNSEVTLEDLNNLFYKEEDEFEPLFDDLKTTKMADAQIRLALLEALKNALKDGNFKFSISRVRELCETHKSYNQANFSSNFKKNKVLFGEEYSRGTKELSLSPKGKKELEKIVIEIAR